MMSKRLENIFDSYKNIRGEPQLYKDVAFYPILLKDMDVYNTMCTLLMQPKHIIADKQILKMSYLKFMLYAMGGDLTEEVVTLFKHICQTDDVHIGYKPKKDTINSLSDFDSCLVIRGIYFTEYEFELIREIILEQCGISLSYVEEFDPSLEEKLNIFNQGNGKTTFEDKLFSFCAFMKKLPNDVDIWNMTIYQFNNQCDRNAIFVNYTTVKPLELGGFVSFKNKKDSIPNWQQNIPERGRYSDILISTEEFKKNSDIMKASITK